MWFDLLIVIVANVAAALVCATFDYFVSKCRSITELDDENVDSVAVALSDDADVCVSFGRADDDGMIYQHWWMSLEMAEFFGEEIAAVIERSKQRRSDLVEPEETEKEGAS